MDKITRQLRKDTQTIFQSGIAAADPYHAVKNSLTVAENHFEIALDLDNVSKKRYGRWTKIHLIAFGKAACGMAKAAQQVIPKHRLADKPLVITNYQNVQSLKGIEVIAASHPLPDMSGQKATRYLIKKLQNTKMGELVLILISGGGSALTPFPAAGISLKDKTQTTDLLLASGANINEINCVRKHLSQIKGGQLAKHALPADLHALILSDVLGDDISTIASGPTVPDNSTFNEAIRLLKEKNIWHKTPRSVQDFLQKGAQGNNNETPKTNDPCFKHTTYTLIGSNAISLNALALTAKNMGYQIDIFSRHLSGEAKDAGQQLALYAKQRLTNGLHKAIAILAGGETTVTLKGTGKGGRNQELALAFALAAEKYKLNAKWAFLSAGTDGLDGPTDAAGGLVDPNTLTRIRKNRINPENRLKNNDSYSALKKSLDLVITGATGTNVADFQVLLIQPE